MWQEVGDNQQINKGSVVDEAASDVQSMWIIDELTFIYSHKTASHSETELWLDARRRIRETQQLVHLMYHL